MSEPSSALLPALTDLDLMCAVKFSSLSDVQSMIIVFRPSVFGFFFWGDSIVLEDRFMLFYFGAECRVEATHTEAEVLVFLAAFEDR